MLLDRLELIDYKSFKEYNLNFSKNINILIADNGSGKSNILESIYLSLLGKSFRDIPLKYSVTSGLANDKFAFIKLISEYYGEITTSINNTGKRAIYKNGKQVRVISRLLYQVLVYAPNSIDIIIGRPEIRRDFLDMILQQINPGFKKLLNSYAKILRLRSKSFDLLKLAKVEINYLEFITEQLIEVGSEISWQRIQLIKKMFEVIPDTSKELLNLLDHKWVYSVESNYLKNSESKEAIQLDFKRKLIEYKEKEILLSRNLVGPHRDDFIFHTADKESRYIMSRGQQRLFGFILLISGYKVMHIYNNLPVLLLLDDLLSELDKSHRGKILEYLVKYSKLNSNQVIITCPDILYVPRKHKNTIINI